MGILISIFIFLTVNKKESNNKEDLINLNIKILTFIKGQNLSPEEITYLKDQVKSEETSDLKDTFNCTGFLKENGYDEKKIENVCNSIKFSVVDFRKDSNNISYFYNFIAFDDKQSENEFFEANKNFLLKLNKYYITDELNQLDAKSVFFNTSTSTQRCLISREEFFIVLTMDKNRINNVKDQIIDALKNS